MKQSRFLLFLAFGVLLILLIYGFNAGKILDISQKPQKVDVIVVLGGDWTGYRVRKALTLYKNHYSRKKRIIVNGCQQIFLREKRKVYRTEISYLVGHGIPRENIDTANISGNTMDEIQWIKKYMLNNGYHSLIIITDPPHTRRVSMLTKIADYGENGIKVILIGADVPWWNRTRYYEDVQALRYMVFETIKIPFNYLAYEIIEKTGLKPFISKYFQDTIWWLKSKIIHFLNAL